MISPARRQNGKLTRGKVTGTIPVLVICRKETHAVLVVSFDQIGC